MLVLLHTSVHVLYIVGIIELLLFPGHIQKIVLPVVLNVVTGDVGCEVLKD